VLQCDAVWWRVVRCVAVCFSVLRYSTVVCCSVFVTVSYCNIVLQCVTGCCRVVRCVAVCFSVLWYLPCAAVCCSMFGHSHASHNNPNTHTLQHTATHNRLQRTAAHCNTQQTTRDCNTLQQTKDCNTLPVTTITSHTHVSPE